MALPKGEEAALARLLTSQAVETLTEILRDRDMPQDLRDEAAQSLIARGFVAPALRPSDPAKLH